MQKPESLLGVWIAIGVLLGVGMDNVGVGIAIGVAIGVAMYTSAKKKKDKE